MPGFVGIYCEIASDPKSVFDCASQCLDKCLKECKDTEITCYSNCSDECNSMCIDKLQIESKPKTNLSKIKLFWRVFIFNPEIIINFYLLI